MMYKIPEIIPLTQIQHYLTSAPGTPIILTQNDVAVAVLVSPEMWNNLMTELEDLRDALDALNAYRAYQQEPEAVRAWSDIRAELVSEGHLDE